MVYNDVLKSTVDMETQSCLIVTESNFDNKLYKVPIVTETGQNLTLVFEPICNP